MSKRALVTGITGQDGAYLAKLLLEKGYEVYGACRRSASTDFGRLAELGVEKDVQRVDFDLLEPTNVVRVVDRVRPDELYNLASQSSVAVSFEQPAFTTEANALGVLRLLEAIRETKAPVRFYQASTCEMFGKASGRVQNEASPFHPRSPYAVSKLYAHCLTINYRESYGLFGSSGILFNHESPLRGTEFVTRKITKSFAQIRQGELDFMELGNMEARRDWGFAGDYVEGMWRMLQQDVADDYVLATGEVHSVREFVEVAGEAAGFEIEFSGEGIDTVGIDRKSGRTLVRTRAEFYRPAEVDYLCGDASKARRILGWQPKVDFRQVTAAMVKADIDRLAHGAWRA